MDPVEIGGGDVGGGVDDAGAAFGQTGDTVPDAEHEDLVAEVQAELVGGDPVEHDFAVAGARSALRRWVRQVFPVCSR